MKWSDWTAVSQARWVAKRPHEHPAQHCAGCFRALTRSFGVWGVVVYTGYQREAIDSVTFIWRKQHRIVFPPLLPIVETPPRSWRGFFTSKARLHRRRSSCRIMDMARGRKGRLLLTIRKKHRLRFSSATTPPPRTPRRFTPAGCSMFPTRSTTKFACSEDMVYTPYQ